MTPERWQRVAEVFERVIASAPDERAAALDDACTGDPDLRAEVESLLANYVDAGDESLDEGRLSAAVRDAAEAFAPLAGTHLGPYAVVELIGRGGMGEVYRARDTRLGREVAIKVLPVTYSSDPDRLHRFEREARAAGMLNHSNVLTVYDVGTHEGSPFIVSELLEGATLRERLGGDPLPTREVVAYARQIVSGLAAAHDRGIVHRDLKPENLFVTRRGRVKILDFGVAKLLGPADAAEGGAPPMQTRSGVVVGTASYMSPEQARGERVDSRSDLFSFGAILYEMLAGRMAFERPTATQTMTAIVEAEAPALADLGVSVPAALERVVLRCLEKHPVDRFPSARDLELALDDLARTPRRSARATTAVVALALAAGVAAVWFVGTRVYAAGVRAGRAAVE